MINHLLSCAPKHELNLSPFSWKVVIGLDVFKLIRVILFLCIISVMEQNPNGGISTIIKSPGKLVHGVIYEVDVRELQDLDILESVPHGLFHRETFLVLGEDK